jgi:hypothetical protein
MTKSKVCIWCDIRGTSSVEVVVMLPMFIILLSAVYFCHARAAARHDALTAARGCAFQFAMNGCRSTQPDIDLCDGAQAQKLARIESGESTGVFSTIERIPLLGAPVKALFGEGARGQARRKSPGFMGADALEHDERVMLVCNTTSRSFLGHVKDSFCDLVESVLEVGDGDGDSVHIPGC